MKKYFPIALIIITALPMASCKKFEFNYAATGEAVGAFKLVSPSDNNPLLLNSATPATPLLFTWSPASAGVKDAVSYLWQLDLKTGDFSKPIAQLTSDNGGAATQLTLSHKSLDSILGLAGIAANINTDLKWTVVASNSTGTTISATPFNLSVTRFGTGITAFTIFSPASSTDIVTTDPGATSTFFNFKWQKATAVPSTIAITYRVAFVQKQFDALGNVIPPGFASPLFTIASNNSGADTLGDFSYKQISDSLNMHGLTDQGAVSQLQWTVIATAGSFSSQALYYNDLYIVREIKMYLVGAFQGWDPSKGIPMIPDGRDGLLNSMYYDYIYLPAGEFKFLQGKDWSAPGYGDGGGDNLSGSGGNLKIATAGVYRVTINRAILKYDISAGRMGFVGAATSVGWNPPSVFPASAMSFINTNQFVGVRTFTTGQWKMIDNSAWDNGSKTVNETRSYSSNGASGSIMQVNNGNMPDITTGGEYRVVWDASDIKNPIYQMMPATEMRVVGNGIKNVNEWDPGSSPKMTYMGNGIWKATLSLIAGKSIKFLAGDAWGAFDYEDAGDGKIKYDGDSNFNTPTADGTYTVTLDENAGTYTIL